MNIWVIVHTLLSRLLIGLVLVLFLPVLGIAACLPKSWRIKSHVLFKFLDWYNFAILKATLLPMRYTGSNTPIREPVIFAANHQSSIDIPLLTSVARGHPHLWLARHELMDSWLLRFLIPVFAEILQVDSPKKAVRSLRSATQLAEESHAHIMIFPEGQRYTDGQVHDFFGGFVWIAKRTQRPLVPVRIFGVEKAYPPGTFWMQNYPITIVIGEPMRYQENESDEEFKNRVHEWFIKQKE